MYEAAEQELMVARAQLYVQSVHRASVLRSRRQQTRTSTVRLAYSKAVNGLPNPGAS